MSDDDKYSSGYAVRELLRALHASSTHTDAALRQKAEQRARGWMDVLTDIASGVMKLGSRQPRDGVPVWVTPQILRGGFATKLPAAGGSLLPHERARAAELGLTVIEPWTKDTTRDALNADALSPEGIARLTQQLREGAYRVGVPEEAALLVVAWLIEKGEHESVAKLLELISPKFPALRFYPQPAAPQLERETAPLDAPVLLQTTESVAASLSKKGFNNAIEAQHESITIWAPMTDAFVALMLEALPGPVHSFESLSLAPDFAARRTALLHAYEAARTEHVRCLRPHRPGEVLGTLVEALRLADDPNTLDEATKHRALRRLREFVTAYGTPGSDAHRACRAAQAKAHGIPHQRFFAPLVARLRAVSEGLGIEDLARMQAAITDDEASASKLPSGAALPSSLKTRVEVAVEAPLTTHLAEGRISSSEVFAKTLPQLTGPAMAKRFDDAHARRLYSATYRAFKQRRSLLLLGLQHQVRFQELPWVSAMESLSDRRASEPAHALLASFTTLAFETFPQAITPNKLVSELSTLAKVAFDAPLPLVEELASDIFMGTFTEKFLKAAQTAARVLGEDSVYARYYGIPYARIQAMRASEVTYGKPTSAAFDALCEELADAPPGNARARNGMVIEQASILTTHNLAVLTDALNLELPFAFLAMRVFNDVLDMLELKVLPENTPHRTRMKSTKNLAFAWRQMLFFLSRANGDEVTQFSTDAHALLMERSALAQKRFMPVMRGLDVVLEGGTLTRWDANAPRLLGWSTTRSALLGPLPT